MKVTCMDHSLIKFILGKIYKWESKKEGVRIQCNTKS